MLKNSKYFISLILAGSLFSGCGTDTPDTVVKDFIDGTFNGDFKKVSKALSEKDKDFFENHIINLCRQSTTKASGNMFSSKKKVDETDAMFTQVYTELLEKNIILDFKLTDEKKEIAVNKCFSAITKAFNQNDKKNIPKVLSSEVNGDKAIVKIQNSQSNSNISEVELKKSGDSWLLVDFRELLQ